MGLSRLERQPLVHRRADRDFVAHPDINTWNRDRAALAAAHDDLPQNVHPVSSEERCRLHFVEGRVRSTVGRRLAATATMQLSGPRLSVRFINSS